jgi:hypothetical protein
MRQARAAIYLKLKNADQGSTAVETIFSAHRLLRAWVGGAVGNESDTVEDGIGAIAGGAGDLVLCQAKGLVAGWAG